jgi:stage II sporulation protein E
MYACMNYLGVYKKRKLSLRLNVDEAVSGALILTALFCGITSFTFISFDFTLLFAVSLILIATYTAPQHSAVLLGCALGLGAALGSGQYFYIALFCSMGIVSAIFKTKYRLPSCVAIILVHLLFGLYFNAFTQFGLWEILAAAIPCALFLIVPDKLLKSITLKFNSQDTKYSGKFLINQNQESTAHRLLQISEVFYEMDKVFRGLVKGNLPMEDAKKMLIAELISNTCDNCSERNKCLRTMGGEIQSTFTDLINIGFEKGKVSLLDLPQFLTAKCGRVNNIVLTLNSLLSQYKEYSQMVTNLDASRVLIAEQLKGISKVLKELAGDVNKNLSFDDECEKKLIEELIYKNIFVSEASVYRQDAWKCGVSLVLKNTDIEKEELLPTISKICSGNMMIDKITPSNLSGLSIVNYVTAPKYEVIFGLAQCFKNNANFGGDTHSLIRIGNDRFLLAVCDGMGAGERAEQASTLAISLIENFYKAGFDNEIILQSVNKLLNLGREDVFSALDVCVIDLKNGLADFVKMGAAVGFIKHANTITKVESSALPLGILEDVSPKVSKTSLDTGDMVILLSDGITDAIGEELMNTINNINTLSPQELADTILDLAKERNKGMPNDDMTVLVARVFLA